MSIFTHTNGDGGDSMDVYVTDSGTIEFHTAIHGQYGSSCRVPKEDALRLYAAIGEALYPVHTPEAPNRSLIEQLIDKAVKDAVTAILPLHLAPAGDRWGYVDATPNPYATQSSPGLCRDCGDTRPSLALYHACTADMPDRPFDDEDAPELCNIPGCMITGMPGTHFAHDPALTTCAAAGQHRPQECPEATPSGRWEAELRRDAGRSIPLPYCGECGHSWTRHNRGEEVRGCSVRHCHCNSDGKP